MAVGRGIGIQGMVFNSVVLSSTERVMIIQCRKVTLIWLNSPC